MPPATTPPPWRGGAYTGPLGVSDLPDWLLQRNLPGWLTSQNPGADPASLVGRYRDFLGRKPNAAGASSLTQLYQGYLAANPQARGNRILFGRSGRTPQNGWTPPPAAGGPAGAPPAPVPPPGEAVPQPAPATPPSAVAPTAPPASSAAQPFGPTDLYDAYKAAIPVLDQARDQQISSAMAKAGFTGNRYSSSAMKTAGDIGAQTAMKQNELLTNLLYEQGNRDLDRALSATNTSLSLAGLQDQMERSRLEQLFSFGRWEQGRQDDLARLAYEDWDRNKYGLLPLLIQFAGSQSGGSAPTPYVVQQPGSPGIADWLTVLGGLFS